MKYICVYSYVYNLIFFIFFFYYNFENVKGLSVTFGQTCKTIITGG